MISTKRAYIYIFGIIGWLILTIMVWWAFLFADQYVWSYFNELYIEFIAINLVFGLFVVFSILDIRN